jgi:hypothetical protein
LSTGSKRKRATDEAKPMKPSDEEIYRRQKFGLAWLAGYLLWTGLIVWSVYQFRAVTMEQLDTPEARASWEQWRRDAAQQSTDGQVQHKVPASAESPGLVLMRDYFGVMLAAAIVFGSALFAISMFLIRGALSPNRPLSD